MDAAGVNAPGKVSVAVTAPFVALVPSLVT